MVRLTIIILLVSTLGFGQEMNDDEKFQLVQVQPEYEGGMGEFYKYIFQNLDYPSDGLEKGIEGKVFVEFVIDTTGAIIDEAVRVHKGVHDSLDKEAVRLVKECPDWQPGRLTPNGKAAKVRMVVPITFRIDKKSKKRKRKQTRYNKS